MHHITINNVEWIQFTAIIEGRNSDFFDWKKINQIKETREYIHNKTANIFYNIVGSDFVELKDFSFDDFSFDYEKCSWNSLREEFVKALIYKHNQSVFSTEKWKYIIDLKKSETYPYMRQSDIFQHKMNGFNIFHYLHIDDEVIEMPYYKTSLISLNLIEEFVENYCIMPRYFGFKNIRPGLFKKIKSFKNKHKIKNKEEFMTFLALEKLLK